MLPAEGNIYEYFNFKYYSLLCEHDYKNDPMPFQRILTLVFFSLGAVLARIGQLKVPSSFLLALSLMAHPFPVQAQLSDADIR